MQYLESINEIRKGVTVAGMIFVAIFLTFQAPLAMAHAALVKSDPPRRATLSISPKQIQLWFNEKIEASYAAVSVSDSKQKSVTDNNPEIDPQDPKSVILNLPTLEAGSYTVRYRVLSVDGHVIESKFDFSVKPKNDLQ